MSKYVMCCCLPRLMIHQLNTISPKGLVFVMSEWVGLWNLSVPLCCSCKSFKEHFLSFFKHWFDNTNEFLVLKNGDDWWTLYFEIFIHLENTYQIRTIEIVSIEKLEPSWNEMTTICVTKCQVIALEFHGFFFRRSNSCVLIE